MAIITLGTNFPENISTHLKQLTPVLWVRPSMAVFGTLGGGRTSVDEGER